MTPEPRPRPPADEAELVARATALAGRRVRAVADRFDLPTPDDLKRHKGWVGQLLEYALGASAASRAEPDFPHLAVELKTIPVDSRAAPRESTYVCVCPLDGVTLAKGWEASWARRKLARVLFVPVVQQGDEVVGDRLIGAPVFWEPSKEDSRRLQADWEEIAERISLGELARLDASVGEVLQLRPKAANLTETTWVLDADAEWVETGPRGFYLRRSFTKEILQRAFG
jgi:DNA mismatch repair protein MutH